jgi:hypothetical protein
VSALLPQVREAIKWDHRNLTIAGYTRHYFPDGKWLGDRCGCFDDRCIGYHHNDESDCTCFAVCLDEYANSLPQGES